MVDATKSIAIIIVTLNKDFSKPRLVWNAELKLSPPPKAPPREEPVFCIRTSTASNIARTICI